MKTADDLNLMVDFATELANSGFSSDEVDAQLKKQGSSLNEVGSVMKYGADNILKARQAIQDYQPENLSFIGALGKTLSDPESLKQIGKAGISGGENVINSATLNAYDWATKKLADLTGVESLDSAKRREEVEQDLGTPAKVANVVGGIAGAVASPVNKLIPAGAGGVGGTLGQRLTRYGLGGLTGAGIGAVRSGFESDFDKDAIKSGATVGGILGAVTPMAVDTVVDVKNLAGKGLKALGGVSKKAIKKTPILNLFTKDSDEIAQGAEKISGMKPDLESTGSAVRRLAEDVQADINRQGKALYDEAERIAGNPKIVMNKKSNLYQEIKELSENTTKSGKRELNGVWREIGHTKKNAPTYNALKTLRSELSSRSAKATGTLTENQYGKLVKAIEKDMESGVGSDAKVVFDEAKSFYAYEKSNPNSMTNSVNKMLGKFRDVSDSELGNRAVSSAQGKTWKATALNNLLKAGSAENVDAVKRGIQANTTTTAQFNRMTPEQKIMIYGDKLNDAVKNFRGGWDYESERLFNYLGDLLKNNLNIRYNPRVLSGILSGVDEVKE